MLSGITINNFKAFGERQHIPMAPITLIFGANSAGKSSILQSLLLLKQTLRQAENDETLLIPKGDLVDLGNFREMVYEHEIDRVCEIVPMLTSSPALDSAVRTALRPFGPLPIQTLGLGFQFGYDSGERIMRMVRETFYWGTSAAPLFEITPKQLVGASKLAPEEDSIEEPKTSLISDTRQLEISSLQANHPLWNTLYHQFMNDLRAGYERQVQQNLDLLESYESTLQLQENRKESSDEAREEREQMLRFITASLGSKTATDIPSAVRIVRRQVRELRSRLNKLANYSLSQFVADTHMHNSQRALRLRNFLVTEQGSSRPQGGYLPLSTRQPLPDLVRLSANFSASLRQIFQRMVYLGPLRESPERHYIFSGNVSVEVGKSGRLLPDLLFKQPDLVNMANRVLQDFHVGYTLLVQKVDDPTNEDVFGLRLVDDRTGTAVSMLDVGFGISQVLPIIVQSLLSENTTILIEQPEIHLHPRLQAELGTLFAQSIKAPQNNQFIVETHSEHLILRLQRLIRAGEIKATDVSVLYVMKQEAGSVCFPLRLDEEGDFRDRWPEGFFDEGFHEVFAGR